MEIDPHLLSFYSAGTQERDRLTKDHRGEFEFLRTQELLECELPEPPAEVFDVGGAADVCASWLAVGASNHLLACGLVHE